MPLDGRPVGPVEHGPRGQLGTVVADGHHRPAAVQDQGVEFAGDPPAADRGVGDQRQRLSREVVDHRQHPEAPAPGENVGNEVQRPALVGALGYRHRCPGAGGAFAAAPAPNAQPFLAVQPIELLGVHRHVLPRQQDAEPPISEPASLAGQVPQPLADLRCIHFCRPPYGLRVNIDQPAGAPLREAMVRHQTRSRRPTRRRRSQFFANRSFSAATSSIDSASSFFSRRFSSSRPFSR